MEDFEVGKSSVYVPILDGCEECYSVLETLVHEGDESMSRQKSGIATSSCFKII